MAVRLLKGYWLVALFLAGSVSPLVAGQPVSEKGKSSDPQVSVEVRIVTMPHACALKCSAPAGMNDSAGMPLWLEDADCRRAMQTALAESIMRLEPIAGAHIHIDPQPTLFPRDPKPPTASVMLWLKPGSDLSPSLANGIISLVSHSVKGLAPDQITVVDNSGRVLSEPRGSEQSTAATAHVEYQCKLETCPGTLGNSCNADGLTFLSSQQLAQLLQAAQEDANSSMIQTPRMTIGNGQSAELCQKENRFFVTSLSVQQVRGQQVYIPCNNLVESGFKLAVRPTVSADQRFVHLEMNGKFSFIESVPLIPVRTFITPVLEGGAIGQPVPFTQYIQQPKVLTTAADQKVTLPDGGTVLLAKWHTLRDFEDESGTPILSDLPYLGDLFKSKVSRQEEMDVLVLVTPRIIGDSAAEHVAANSAPSTMPVLHIEEEEEAFEAQKCCDKAAKTQEAPVASSVPPKPLDPFGFIDGFGPAAFITNLNNLRDMHSGKKILEVEVDSDAGLTGCLGAFGELQRCSNEVCQSSSTAIVACLLAKYESACAKGQSAEASKLAMAALLLDPMCFSKAHAGQQAK